MRRWFALFSLIPGIAMVFVDQSVLPVALPTLQTELDATSASLWWCINSYLLVSAVLMLACGKWGDRIGYRKAYIIGIGVFGASSVLCGLSTSAAFLIGARALQGVGAALMVPASSPLIMSLFPQNQRGRAIGVNVSISSLFLIMAPLIGGYLIDVASWRAIFWINIPLALLGVFLVPFFVPDSQGKKTSFDPIGFFFFALSSSALIIFIMQGEAEAWVTWFNGALFVLFCVFGIFLFRREKTTKNSFFDLSLFRHPVYKAVNVSVFATQFVMMITVYRAVFFQEVMGWSPFKSGVVFCLTSTPILFTSPLGGWLADHFGPKKPITIGFILLILSFVGMVFFVDNFSMVIVSLLAFGIGIPLIFTPSYSSAMGAIPPQKAGAAFGVLATVRSLGATLGVALITSVAEEVHWHRFLSYLIKIRARKQSLLRF